MVDLEEQLCVRSKGGEGGAIAIHCGCSFIRLVIFELVSQWFCFLFHSHHRIE